MHAFIYIYPFAIDGMQFKRSGEKCNGNELKWNWIQLKNETTETENREKTKNESEINFHNSFNNSLIGIPCDHYLSGAFIAQFVVHQNAAFVSLPFETINKNIKQ